MLNEEKKSIKNRKLKVYKTNITSRIITSAVVTFQFALTRATALERSNYFSLFEKAIFVCNERHCPQ